jgi:hypothetical protein
MTLDRTGQDDVRGLVERRAHQSRVAGLLDDSENPDLAGRKVPQLSQSCAPLY